VIVRFNGFTVDTEARRVAKEGRPVHLTPKAFDLLVLLIGEAPRVVPKNELHQRMWRDRFVSDLTLIGLVKELRRALQDPAAGAPLIRTVHAVGYAFCGTLERPTAQPAISCWIVAAARKIPLQAGENLVGRDPSLVICLNAPGVSRRHARITVGQVARLEDLGSKNGTTVNGTSVAGATPLYDGDRIGVGDALLVFHASAAGPPTATVVVPPARV
jgi:DNA-binding winged helix-turn-helix (wHTH) protein